MLSVSAQQGLPFMTDFELNRQFSDSRIVSMVQDDEETMFFATSRGLIKYDGAHWSRIASSSPVLKLHYHEPSNRVFAGLKEGAAEVVKSDSGTYELQTVQGFDSNQPISHIISTKKEVFFIAESELHIINAITKESSRKYEFPEMLLSGAFLVEERLYLLFYEDGLFSWNDGKLTSIDLTTSFANEQVLFSVETKKGTFIGFENDKLVRFEDERFKAVNSRLQKELSENLMSDGIMLNDSLLALSTLAGGAMIVNIETQQISYRFDYTTGAKDNEVFSLGKDSDNGLWLAYEDGLTRVDLLQPIRSFSAYPGLEGSLTTSLMAKDKLYVGSGNGVFVLTKATNRAEVKRMMNDIRRKQRVTREKQASNYVPPVKTTTKKEKQESKDLIERFKEDPKAVKAELSRKELRELKRELRKQRKDAKKKNIESVEDQEEPEAKKASGPSVNQKLIPNPKTGTTGSGMTSPPGSGATKRAAPSVLTNKEAKEQIEAVRQEIKEKQSSYLFKKVDGIDVKCRQLIELRSSVFAATNNGIYLISNTSARNLTPGVYINDVTVTDKSKTLLLSTLEGVVELKKDASGLWKTFPLNDTTQFVAYNAIEDEDGSIWAGTDNGAFRYFLDEVKFYPIDDVVNERVLVANVYGKVHFLLPNSLYHYINNTDTILPATLPEIPSANRLEFIPGNDDVIWVKSELGWSVLNGDDFIPTLPYLDLFEDVRHIETDDKGNVYIIDKGTDVYSLKRTESRSEDAFNVYIKQVVNSSGIPFSLGDVTLVTDGEALAFKVSAPFYLKSQGTKYQYRLRGKKVSWSRWRNEPIIEPGIIPPGDYVIEVRAKNILGQISEVKSMAFSVPRPIYLRWYAIATYVILLTLLLFTIIKYREKSLKETQRILEQKVAERTEALAKEKEHAEELLLNILPRETAKELQEHGRATAKHYNQVTVMFTDFKGFTQFAENAKPQDLVNELHTYFKKFDEIIGKYNLEKIKTIGDAYMCAGGVPVKNSSNPIAITLAALEIRDYMNEVTEAKRMRNEAILEIRIGIHTGPITAGVVGVKKFAYDIWGDAVNTASRMESSSEPGKINVSGTTHELIKKYFVTEYRGKKEAKGKGLVDMYFIESLKSEFSEEGKGVSANKGIWELIS